MALARIDARGLIIAASQAFGTTGGELSLSLGSSLEVNSGSLRISSSGYSSALASKKVLAPTRSSLQSNPNAVSAEFDPGTGVYGSTANAVKAPMALLKGNDANAEFNTSSGKIGASASPAELDYRCQVLDQNNEPFLDSNGNEVWALLATDSRTVGADVDVYFFSGVWSAGGMVPYTLNDAGGFKVTYPQRYDLSDLPENSFMAMLLEGAAAASLAADSVKGVHIDFADVLLSTGGLQEGASDTLGIKIDSAGMGLSVGSDGLKWSLTHAAEEFTANGSATSQTLANSAKIVLEVTIGGAPGRWKASPATGEQYNVSGTTLNHGASGQETPNGTLIQVRYMH